MKIVLSNHEKEIVRRLKQGELIIDRSEGGSSFHFITPPQWENGEKIDREALNSLVSIGWVRTYSFSASAGGIGLTQWTYEIVKNRLIK